MYDARMALESVAQLLATALLLLQTVSANPTLPESMRVQAQATAQSAITEATRAIGTPASAVLPSCKIASDKYNYRVGEVVVFSWMSTNATSVEFVPDPSGKSVFPTPQGELLGNSGQYRKVVTAAGYPFLTMKAGNERGESTACSAMVNVH